MDLSYLSSDEAKRKIKEAEKLVQEISKAQTKLMRTGSLLRRHLYHTALYCKAT
jgi:hypothetical protein